MIEQIASEGMTLYKEYNDGTRVFASRVSRPDSSAAWLECTQAEQADWEAAHPVEMEDDLTDIGGEIDG